MHRAMQTFLAAAGVMLAASTASAQTADDVVTTPPGQEIRISLGHYTYAEPLPDTPISIHGPKIGASYTGTWLINRRALWHVQAEGRLVGGKAAYDGYCRPWLIRPSSSSPNGYALGLGEAFPCGEDGDLDGYVETRGLLGKDLISRTWGLATASGIGLRYLSNGIAGVADFRTDAYLYVPIRLTARRRLAAHRVVSVSAEYDVLIRGWQTTRQSKLGSGQVPATDTAPSFTIDGFDDFAFSQHRGWALRAGAQYPLARRWFIEPSFVHWNVGASPVESAGVSFTVNGVRARQQLGAYEPDNTTNEWGVSLGLRF